MTGREMGLGFATFLVLLLGITFMVGRGKWEEWKQIAEGRYNLEQQIVLNEKLIDQGETWASRLAAAQMVFKAYPLGVDVTSQLLDGLEALESQTGLKLPSKSPNREEVLGDVCEVSIKCSWEGDLKACVRFLYALQSDTESLNKIQKITIKSTGKKGMLNGQLTVDCAYTRGPTEPTGDTLLVEPVPAP